MTVRCYGCGARYDPTVEETKRHTHHAQAEQLAGRIVTYEQAAAMLDDCQAERDHYAREAAGNLYTAGTVTALPSTVDELVAEASRLYHYDAAHHAAAFAAALVIDAAGITDRVEAASVALTIARRVAAHAT